MDRENTQAFLQPATRGSVAGTLEVNLSSSFAGNHRQLLIESFAVSTILVLCEK